MVIVYLHGFRSSTNAGKSQTLREMFPEHIVIGVEYQPHSPRNASQALSDLFQTLLNSGKSVAEIIVIGTSLGGFWARWVSAEFNVKSLLINPSLHPESTLPTGRFKIFGDELQSVEVSNNELSTYRLYKVKAEVAKNIDCQVWVALNDELLDANAIVSELRKTHRLRTFPTGGHRFEQFHEMRSAIVAFIENK